MRLGQFVRSGVAHPLRGEARADITTEPIDAIADEADDVATDEADGVGTDEADAGTPAAVRQDLLGEHAG
ncbi:MAG: hypothetical protein KY469_18215 [Actinobacteria bacterium]|nr:hypothetical protein [Actinomycetota bacterium]